MNSSPSNPHPQSLGRNPLTPPRFGGRSAPFPTCPSPLARGEGLNSNARPRTCRGGGVSACPGPQSVTPPPPPPASCPRRHQATPTILAKPPKTCRAGRRAGAQVRSQHVRPRRASAPCTGPHRATPSRRPPEAGPVSPQGKRLNPRASQAKRARTAPRTWHVCKMSEASGGEIMPAFGGAVSRFFFSRRQWGESWKRKNVGFYREGATSSLRGGRAP